jgi:hypothetical protein
LLSLSLVGDHSELDTRVRGSAVNEFRQARVVGGLPDVDNGSAPRSVATEFERKSGLADTGRPLNMKVMDATSDKVEIGPSSLDLTLNGCRCLPRNLMLVGVRPVVESP